MKARDRLRPSGQVFVIFTVVAVVSTGTLALLSWQLLAQDRQLEIPRQRGLLEVAADTTVNQLTAGLDQLEAVLSPVGAPHPDGVSVISITQAGAAFTPSSGLLFIPVRAPLPEAEPAVFAEVNAAELQASALPRVRKLYEALTTHPSKPVRAMALARLARVQAKVGDLVSALRAYDALSDCDDVGIGGLPGGLVASVGRASALAARGASKMLRDAATALARDLARGRWRLLQSEYDFYAALVERWLGSPMPVEADALARADAASSLWNQRLALPAEGRKSAVLSRGAAVMVWRKSGDGINAVIGGPLFLSALLRSAVPRGFLIVSLRDIDGRAILGPTVTAEFTALRVVSSAGLTLDLAIDPSAPAAGDSRRSLLVLVIGVTLLALGAGWYFIARALGRERRVARLQNDFVAAVSHEFRSPLTSLAHVSDLLAHDRLPTDGQRRQAYKIMVGDTARLRDLIEHLLDFGRFDAGAVALRLENVNVGAAVSEVVDDARRRVAAQGYTIEYSPSPDPIVALLDEDAFSRAIWNLIDNAVKYSPDCRTVWVATAIDGDRVSITVRDQGLGIPMAEQSEIFGRFVRGAESKARHIKGTGIGLALVRQIVDAHGGVIELTSAPGEGSSFVVKLRLVEDAV